MSGALSSFWEDGLALRARFTHGILAKEGEGIT